ncbi:anhydro-N-acetylmuramic acid kinase AnmK [Peribacillus alkalitolerans]|uniref:anhydro-N-acetylmuramic acid kinase AnmK n=1 Tax=Peribacillus alkalitolerans TaxID=1550385 RepID=UPI0023DDCDE5|nr:anhydro-N-acetylmuramic acid kinase AnmK [Peribacillus alkalitolerans]
MERYVVGLMSGTSLDGVDAALVRINDYGLKTKVDLIDFVTVPFENKIKNEIYQSFHPDFSNSPSICSLNFQIGYVFADAVKKVCENAGFPLEKLDLIGSHGQTIYHIPNSVAGWCPSTLQIGEPAVIAYETGTTVVSNFRTMDMAAGGEGAPLVPYSEYLMFRSEKKQRGLQNIGGIGNITVLPINCSLEDVRAFDTGPGNMIINDVCKRLLNKEYDEDGIIASKGQVHHSFIEKWLGLDFFHLQPPKSTGRELFGSSFTERILSELNGYPIEDILATVTYFTVESIAHSYERFVLPSVQLDELIVGGGGSYNLTLMKMLKDRLIGVRVMTQEDIGLSSEAKEAIAFAILANETAHQNPSNVPSATGAKQQAILGSITFPPNGDRKFIYTGGRL